MAGQFQHFATPHPSALGFRVLVTSDALKVLPAKGTAYRACVLPDKQRANEYGDFVYAWADDAEPGWLSLNFVQPWSGAAFEEFPYQVEGFPWPKILEQLEIYCNNPAPNWLALQADKEAYLFLLKKRERPAYRGATTIIVRRWWSHVPWDAEDFQAAPMQPGPVEWDLMVLRGSVRDCLHGDIKTPGLDGFGGSDFLYNLSAEDPSASPVEAYPSRLWLATNYTTYEDHIYLDGQRPVRGGYLREQYEALAPPLPDIEGEEV